MMIFCTHKKDGVDACITFTFTSINDSIVFMFAVITAAFIFIQILVDVNGKRSNFKRRKTQRHTHTHTRHSVRLINKISWKQSCGFSTHNALSICVNPLRMSGLVDTHDAIHFDSSDSGQSVLFFSFCFFFKMTEKWQFRFAPRIFLQNLILIYA